MGLQPRACLTAGVGAEDRHSSSTEPGTTSGGDLNVHRSTQSALGHEPHVLPAVAVLPWDGDGRVLMVRQADSGRWATIGGAVEPDEMPAHAATREAAEEAGISLELGPVQTVTGGPEFRVRYPNGDETSYVLRPTSYVLRPTSYVLRLRREDRSRAALPRR